MFELMLKLSIVYLYCHRFYQLCALRGEEDYN